MAQIAYTVIAILPDVQTRSEYLKWLEEEHIAAVLAAGALSGRAVQIHEPAEPLQVESQYTFASREAFEAYLREAAPALRAEGLRRFGPERGVRYERRVGMVASALPEPGVSGPGAP